MIRKIKSVLSAVVILVMVVSLTACSGTSEAINDTSSDASTKESSTAKVTENKESAESTNSTKNTEGSEYDVDNMTFNDVVIHVSTRNVEGGDDATGNYYISMVEKFNEMDNGITVEMTNISTESDYLDKLSTDFASGDAPNLFLEYGGARCLDYLESGTLLNIQPYLDEDPEWSEGFLDYWEPCIYEGYEGTYGVPWGAYQVVLYYNKAILEENNVEVPTTWDELMEACATLKGNGVQPFQVGEKDIYRFGHLHTVLSLKTFGPEIGAKLGTREITYDSKEMIQIYDMIKGMVDKGYLGDNLLSTDSGQEDTLFEEGKAAFQYNGSWGAANMQDSDLFANEEIGVTTFPIVNEEYAHVEMGGASDAYFISKLNATEEEIAASVVFLKYITSVEYTNGLVEVNPNTYAIKSTAVSENYLLNEILQLMKETEISKSDLQNYDTQAHMINTVRTALQMLAMENSSEEVGEQIVDTIAQYE